MLVTLTLAYIPSAAVKESRWDYPGAPEYTNYTLIPDNLDEMTKQLTNYDGSMDTMYEELKAEMEGYDGLKAKAEFVFEYVVREDEFKVENMGWGKDKPPDATLRVRFWRLKSGPMIDKMYCCRTHNKEFNFGCSLLRQLNNILSQTLSLDYKLKDLLRGRYIANSEGKSVIQLTNILRPSPTIKGPANYGNPIVLGYNGKEEEVDYDSVYEYYYGMYGSPEYDKQERDDQTAVATFPV
jgi:hypothetical protein